MDQRDIQSAVELHLLGLLESTGFALRAIGRVNVVNCRMMAIQRSSWGDGGSDETRVDVHASVEGEEECVQFGDIW